MVSAIVLAAGESKRMGKLKQLLPLGESTIIEQTIDNLLSSRIGEVIVVMGHGAEEIKRRLGIRQVKIVYNPRYTEGMSTSIAAGLRELDAKADAVMLVLADQPFIDSQTIDKLLDEFGKHDRGIAFPAYRGKRGHPVIFSRRYIDELLKLKGDAGAKELIERHPDDILEVPVDSPGILRDIDTPEAYSDCSS